MALVPCRLSAVHPGGDHSIFVGEVLAIGELDGTRPLLWYEGGYHRPPRNRGTFRGSPMQRGAAGAEDPRHGRPRPHPRPGPLVPVAAQQPTDGGGPAPRRSRPVLRPRPRAAGRALRRAVQLRLRGHLHRDPEPSRRMRWATTSSRRCACRTWTSAAATGCTPSAASRWSSRTGRSPCTHIRPGQPFLTSLRNSPTHSPAPSERPPPPAAGCGAACCWPPPLSAPPPWWW